MIDQEKHRKIAGRQSQPDTGEGKHKKQQNECTQQETDQTLAWCDIGERATHDQHKGRHNKQQDEKPGMGKFHYSVRRR